MYISKKLTLSENQAITATANSTNVIEWPDLAVVPGETAPYVRDLGTVDEVNLHVQVTEDFNNLTSLTLAFVTSTAAGLTSPTTMWSAVVPVAQLKAGYVAGIRNIPPGAMLKYCGMIYTVTGTAPTTGKVTATIAAGD